MRPLDPNDSSRNSASQGTSLPTRGAVLAALAVLVTGSLSTFMVLQLDASRPKVGDIVVFKPGSQDTDMGQMTIPATIVPVIGVAATGVSAMGGPLADCALDPNVMAEEGGSLIVEGSQDLSSLPYRIHWAGGETARTSGSCGGSANLLVSRTDLQRLANSAGGFGLRDKGIAR